MLAPPNEQVLGQSAGSADRIDKGAAQQLKRDEQNSSAYRRQDPVLK
jgi:hypothetical protein